MGKNKKKDPAKKAALQAKKDAKADKAARKRLKKESEALNAGSSGNTNTNTTNEQAVDEANASLDELLQIYQQRDIKGTKPLIESLDGFPPPRGNFSMTVVDDAKKGKQEVYIFGGEYFDGISSIVVDHLLKWTSSDKQQQQQDQQQQQNQHQWQQIIMPSSMPSPPARCAHSTVYYNGALYVFGGELASSDYYHHYKDLWRYDISQQTWRELVPSSSSGGGTTRPSSRSGHAAVVWKSYMIVFGGFFEAARADNAPRWFNDVFVFNLKTECWLDVPHSKLGNRPEPRSACNIALLAEDDTVVVHGGFSKLSSTTSTTSSSADPTTNKETKVHTDVWLLHLKPILQEKPPTWEKVMASSKITHDDFNINTSTTTRTNPNGRSACASTSYNKNNQMILFGGVLDAELMHHKVDSIFFNDIFGLQVMKNKKPKWFPIRPKKKRRQQEQEEQKDDDTIMDNNDNDESPPTKGWDINQLRENMFAFVDGKGNVVYERMDKKTKAKVVVSKNDDNNDDESSDDEEKDEEKEEEKEDDSSQDDEEEETKSNDDDDDDIIKTSSSAMMIDPQTETPKPVQRDEPLPRIKCGAIVHRNVLTIYGGLVEIGDREVTLDDMWCLDLKKNQGWTCMYPGTMHQQVWRGAEVHDDDDSYISSSATTAVGDDNDDDDSDLDGATMSIRSDNRDPALVEELLQLISNYDLGNESITPQHEEVLADYYTRTSEYWNERAKESLTAAAAAKTSDNNNNDNNNNNEPPTKKELKREGFQMARQRFDDLESVLERFHELKISTGGSTSTISKTTTTNSDETTNKDKKKKKKDKKEKKKKSKKENE